VADQDTARHAVEEARLGELVRRLGDQMSTLVRDEIRLAQAEVQEKGKRAGIGAGMFGGAGLLALYGVGALVASAILALGLALEPWAAALIVGGVLLAIAGVLALMGKSRVAEAMPPVPREAVQSVQEDIAVVKERGTR
jgi:uncharacterized membrane protein YqjE